MTDLKMKTETVHIVVSCDFEEFVKEKYPYATDYSFVATEEAGNDSEHRFNATAESYYGDELHEEDMADFHRNDGFKPFFTANLLTDMCKRGYIEPGTYLIEVNW